MKKSLFQLHTAVFLAGFTAVLGKLIGLNEGLLVLYRLAITVISLGSLLLLYRKLQIPPSKDLLKIAGVGCIIAFHWLTFYGSVKYANVSVAVVCLAASGFFTAFLEPLILRKKFVFFDVLLGLLAMAGIYIIFDFHPMFKVGIIFGILAALGSSLFPIFNKLLIRQFAPRELAFYEFSGGVLFLTALLPLYLHFFPAGYFLPTATDWVWLIILSWICTILAFDLQLGALKKISPFTANLAYNLEPVYGIILGFLLFSENKNINTYFYLGILLIIMAVVLQTLRILNMHPAKKKC